MIKMVFVTATKEFAMYFFRMLAAAGIVCAVSMTSPVQAQSRRAPVPPAVPLTVSTQGMTASQVADLRCHSLNIYREARGTSYRNQLAVALVVRNRQRASGRSACAVIYEPGQFSWTAHRASVPREQDSWIQAQNIALLVMRDQVEDITRGATHFHENRLRPSWTRRASHSVRIGAHTFHRIVEVAEAR